MDIEWRRTTMAIDRFNRLADMQIELLDRNRLQIEQFRTCSNTRGVVREQNNAGGSVEQLLSALRQVLALRERLKYDHQRRQFDSLLEPIRMKVRLAVQRLETINSAVILNELLLCDDQHEQEQCGSQQTQQSVVILRDRIHLARMETETHTKLAEEIAELNQLIIDMATLVHSQNEAVDSIEAHMENAKKDFDAGKRNLHKAVGRKGAKLPLMGGLLGAAVVGGPLGVVAGSTVVTVIGAVGGAVAGLYGGRFLKAKDIDRPSD